MNWELVPATEFTRHAAAWDALNRAGGATPLLSSAFVAPLLESFATGKEFLAIATNAGQVQAMTVLCAPRFGTWQSFQPSQAPLGLWLAHPSGDYESLLSSLSKALPGVVLNVGVTQQDPDLVARPAPSERLATLDYIQTARITIHGDFDSYWSARGKNLRHNMKRQRAKLQTDAITPQFESLRAAQDVAAAIADYGKLEAAGWKSSLGTAVTPDNAQGRFYRALLEKFCADGTGVVYRYRFNNKVVAVDLCIEGAGSIIILKTTYDESIQNVSPAFLMRQEAFRELFDAQRLRRIEFYGKLMEWHTRWSDEVRTLYHVNYYRRPLIQRMRQAMRRAASAR